MRPPPFFPTTLHGFQSLHTYKYTISFEQELAEEHRLIIAMATTATGTSGSGEGSGNGRDRRGVTNSKKKNFTSTPELTDDSSGSSDEEMTKPHGPFEMDEGPRLRARVLTLALRFAFAVPYSWHLANSIDQIVDNPSRLREEGLVNPIDEFAFEICSYMQRPAEEPLAPGSRAMIANSIALIARESRLSQLYPQLNPSADDPHAGTPFSSIYRVHDTRFPVAIQQLLAGWFGPYPPREISRDNLYMIGSPEGEELTREPFTALEVLEYMEGNTVPQSFWDRLFPGENRNPNPEV
jgi:hypothetical protein